MHVECKQFPHVRLQEQMTMRLLAVPTSSANFLRVVFVRHWHIVVNHSPDIRLVDAHTKRNCGHHDL